MLKKWCSRNEHYPDDIADFPFLKLILYSVANQIYLFESLNQNLLPRNSLECSLYRRFKPYKFIGRFHGMDTALMVKTSSLLHAIKILVVDTPYQNDNNANFCLSNHCKREISSLNNWKIVTHCYFGL